MFFNNQEYKNCEIVFFVDGYHQNACENFSRQVIIYLNFSLTPFFCLIWFLFLSFLDILSKKVCFEIFSWHYKI